MTVTTSQVIRLGILSDIHATVYVAGKELKSFVTVPAVHGKRNPLDDLAMISKNRTLDYLLCPGDITNQADPQALSWMWGELHKIKDAFKALDLCVVCGNHDVDSRHATNPEDDPDPKGVLLDLAPSFPTLDPDAVNHFWARNYVIIEKLEPLPHRLLLLNTCAYHGGSEAELKHGRISTRTINRIKTDLEKRDPSLLNILLCHHHLEPLPSWNNSPDYQFVKKGGELLRMLESVCVGPWLVVHGHRHWPECFYASGGNSSAVVFCSSSFGARDPEISNQFHILTIEADPNFSRPRGRIETFTWTLGGGWTEGPTAEGPRSSKSLAYLSGFGFSGNIKGLASKISSQVGNQTNCNWEDIALAQPDLYYLLPTEFAQLKIELLRLNIGVYEEHGRPIEIGKKEKK